MNAFTDYVSSIPVWNKSFREGATHAVDIDMTTACKMVVQQALGVTKDPSLVSAAISTLGVLKSVLEFVLPTDPEMLANRNEVYQSITDLTSSVRESTAQNALTMSLTQFVESTETAGRAKMIIQVKSSYDQSRTGHSHLLLDLLSRSRITAWQLLQKSIECNMGESSGVASDYLKALKCDVAVIEHTGGPSAVADLNTALTLADQVKLVETGLSGIKADARIDTLQKLVDWILALELLAKTPQAFHVADFKTPYDDLRAYANGIVETSSAAMNPPINSQAKKLLLEIEKKTKALTPISLGDEKNKSWHTGSPNGEPLTEGFITFLEGRLKKMSEVNEKTPKKEPMNSQVDDKMKG